MIFFSIICIIIILALLVKLNKKQKIDEEIKKTNEVLKNLKQKLTQEAQQLQEAIDSQSIKINILENEVKEKEFLTKQIENEIIQKRRVIEAIEDNQESILEASKEKAAYAYSLYCEDLDKDYKKKEEEYDKLLILLLNSYSKEQQKQMAQMEQITQVIKKLEGFQNSLIEAQLREQKFDSEWSKFKLTPSAEVINDIEMFNSIKNKLKNPRVLNMLIWSTYFQKDMNQLCINILGIKPVTGIYKITNRVNPNNKLCYIGQSVDIARRWKDHAKCGLGIDAPASNKLYKAMQEHGIWNFTWELLEECPKGQLNEKEKYYIDFYKSNKVGYNSTKGNN